MRWLSVVGALAVLAFVVSIAAKAREDERRSQELAAQRQQQAVANQQAETARLNEARRRFDAMTPAEHLAAAEAALAAGGAGPDEASRHVSEIREDAGVPARALAAVRRGIDAAIREQGRQRIESERAAARAVESERAERRRRFAAAFDRVGLASGMEFDSVEAREPQTLFIVYVGCSRSLVFRLSREEAGQNIRDAGFSRIECETPYTHRRYSIDL